MAGDFKPSNVKVESRYKIYDYNLHDPAENLFNGGDANSVYAGTFAGTYVRTNYNVSQWASLGHYLDIEFLDDTVIWEYGHTGNELAIYKNTNGIKTDFVTNLLQNHNPNTWVKIAELPKGRYLIEKNTSTGVRVAYEWYLENNERGKMALKNPQTNQYYSLAEKTLILLPNDSDETMFNYGIGAGIEIKLDESFNTIRTIVENTDGTQTVTDKTVEPFSVYDYISETPIFLVHNESTDDIIVDTVTEPFDLYDELGEQVELIYYTDDESITESKAKIIANYTPLDELDGNFDIVTWTDEEDDTAIRELEFEALPTSKFIISDELKRVSELVGADNSGTFKNTRFLFSENKEIWLRWNGTEFVNVTVPNINKNETIFKLGNTIEEISSIDTDTLSEKWENKSLYIGMLIQDKTHGNSVTDINLSSTQLLPTYTSTLSDLRFYILNTTAKIELNLEGNTLKGMLSDDDLTRVQYKVELNGKPYFPADGSYTELHDPPSNINLLIDTDKIRFNEENTLKIEFLDFFGTTDYYEYTFIGDYAGLMFKDIHGKHYSSDIGEILQYLDFKTVLSGETTPPHEVILKNQYGYDIKNVFMYADKAEFPTGLQLQFSKALSPFTPVPTLDYSLMENGREENFFVRLTSDRYTKPNGMSEFDIIVLAEKVE